MGRSEARELLMQMIYQMEAQQDFSIALKDKFVELNVKSSKQDEYFNFAYLCISNNLKEIDEKIEKATNNWKLSRIAKVDLAVLRLASAELIYMDDVPKKVAINEAIELSKKFGSEESGKFVNGVLGKLVTQLEE